MESRDTVDIIKIALQDEKGVFIGLVHDDLIGHTWLLEQLEKNNKDLKYFFIETNQVNISAWKEKISKEVLPLNLPQRELGFHFKKISNENHMVYSFLYAHYILDLNIIGIDSVSHEDREYLNANRENEDLLVVKNFLEIRMKNNEIMKENIEKELSKEDGKYVVFGGLLHNELASLLGIKNISLISKDIYDLNVSNLNKYFLIAKMNNDIIIYDNKTKKSIIKSYQDGVATTSTQAKEDVAQIDSELSNDEFSLTLKGIFNQPNKSYEKLKKEIKEKYNLPDDSEANLEKGLRMAAFNNQKKDILNFLKLGVDINAFNQDGSTALHYAIKKQFIDCARTLLEKGAKYDIIDKDNQTAFNIAQNINNEEILKLFPELSPSNNVT